MGTVWALVLPLLFICWEAEVSGSSAGPSTSRAVPLVIRNNTLVPDVTQGFRTSSEGGFQTVDLTETAPGRVSLNTQTLSTETVSKSLIPASTISVEKSREAKTTSPKSETREAQIMSPAIETNILTKTSPSNFTAEVISPVETSVMRGSWRTGTIAAERRIGLDIVKAVSDKLGSDDSSEETKRIAADSWPLVRTSAGAESWSSESSTSLDGSISGITTSHVLAQEIPTEPKTLVTYSITHTELTSGNMVKTETATAISGTSDTDYSPTGAQALSTSVTSASPTSTEAEPHIPTITASAETLSTVRILESSTPDTTPEVPQHTSGTTERETTAAEDPTHSGTLVAVSMSPWEETSALSAETTRHLEGSGAGSAVGRGTSPAGLTASVASPSEVATIQNSMPPETFTTDGTTTGSFPVSTTLLPPVHPTTANSSQESNFTLGNTTTPPKPPTTTSNTAGTRQTTQVTAGGDGGFLLVRLSVTSPEDLTEPTEAERLMKQLQCELHAHLPLVQVSLLRVRRG